MKTDYLETLPEEWLPAAAVFAALGDAIRQKILLMFEPKEELSIKEICDSFSLSRTAIVHHLTVLERAGVLQQRRLGKSALYSVKPDVIMAAIDGLREYILLEYPELAADGSK